MRLFHTHGSHGPEATIFMSNLLRTSVPELQPLPATQHAPIPDLSVGAGEFDVVRRVGFLATVVLVFLKVSMLHEAFAIMTGFPPPVMYVVFPPAVLGMAFSGGFQRALHYFPAKLWVAFIAWIALGVPFSFWMGGSAGALMSYCRDNLILLFLVAGTVVTVKEHQKLVNAIALGISGLIGYFLVRGGEGRRMAMGNGGTIGDPNDLAAHLILFMPFLLYVICRSNTAKVYRSAAILVFAAGLYTLLRTGSRGGAVAAAITVAVFLIRGTAHQRIVALIVLPVGLAAALAVLPQQVLQRLTSFGNQENATEEAVQSAEERRYLLKRGIEFTLHNPVFGVGLAQFSSFEGSVSIEEGSRGNWHVTHNTYLQASSEAGIPALCFLLAAIFTTVRLLAGVCRRAKQLGQADQAMLTNFVFVGLIGFCVAITFLNFALHYHLPLMTGFAIATHAVHHRWATEAASRNSGAPSLGGPRGGR